VALLGELGEEFGLVALAFAVDEDLEAFGDVEWVGGFCGSGLGEDTGEFKVGVAREFVEKGVELLVVGFGEAGEFVVGVEVGQFKGTVLELLELDGGFVDAVCRARLDGTVSAHDVA
jgi:hypothetical protein